MSRMPARCPACESELEVARLVCTSCEVKLEGHFTIPPLLRLGREDLDFVVAFVRASGSLKEMGKLLGLSYPTVRNRLNEIIEKLEREEEDLEGQRRQILDEVASGKLSVKEGARRLKELAG